MNLLHEECTSVSLILLSSGRHHKITPKRVAKPVTYVYLAGAPWNTTGAILTKRALVFDTLKDLIDSHPHEYQIRVNPNGYLPSARIRDPRVYSEAGGWGIEDGAFGSALLAGSASAGSSVSEPRMSTGGDERTEVEVEITRDVYGYAPFLSYDFCRLLFCMLYDRDLFKESGRRQPKGCFCFTGVPA